MRINILFGGQAGQGPNILTDLAAQALIKQGYYVFYSRDYQSLIRGGHNFNVLTFSDNHVNSNDSKIDIISVVKDMCDLKQICTQSAGLRPLGVSLLVGGVEEDGTIKLFLTEPYGLYFQHYAAVIGEGEPELTPELEKKYKPGMSIDEGFKLGLGMMKGFLKSDFNFDRMVTAFIDVKDKRYTKLSNDEMKKLMK